MSYAGDAKVYKAAWERSDSVGSRYYAARIAAGIEDSEKRTAVARLEAATDGAYELLQSKETK